MDIKPKILYLLSIKTKTRQNPNIKDSPAGSVEKYCDCALKLIVDEGKDRRESGYQCAKETFN